MRILFIGLGTMGGPMARRLIDNGVDVGGWDEIVEARACHPFATETLDAGLADADVVITMLPEGKDVAGIYRESVFRMVKSGTLLVDCSTIDVSTTRTLSEEATATGLAMIDAPVSGGAEGAGVGALSFMVGGDDAAIARAVPLLEVMGKAVTRFGPSGSGQAAKACHNMICGITALGVCEAFALADGLGLEADKFFQLCKGAAAQSWILENRCPVPGPAPDAPSSNDYAPGFAARLMAKDLRLGQEAARHCGQETPFGALAAERFTSFAEEHDGDLDFSSIYRTVRQE